LQRSRHLFCAVASTILIAAASTVVVPGSLSAGPADNVAVEAAPPQGAGPSPVERDALFACMDAAEPKAQGDLSGATGQLQNPDNRIEGQDWSGQDLSGKNFRGKVLVGVKLTGAKLRGADLTDAIICGSDLTGADLSGAHLDRALIGGDTNLKGANLTNASGRALKIANASARDIRIDGADLRGAGFVCFQIAPPTCSWSDVSFASMTGADLRGATIDRLWESPSSLHTAHLDQMTTQLDGDVDLDFAQLADGVGESGRITFIPSYGHSGLKTDFTGGELRQLAAVLPRIPSTSSQPSFDCARAKTDVEKAVCADPKLAALDNALNWLWKRVEHTSEQMAAQKKWTATRGTCPTGDPKTCIGLAYAERIRQLGPKSSSALVGSGTYTTDPPLELPQGQYSALVRKFLMARGYREDEITVENLGNGAGKVSGDGLWANGHLCGFEASEAEVERMGSKFRINDNPAAPDEKYNVSFIITPQVVIWAGGDNQFQCGARGSWSEVYYRQPDELVSKAKASEAAH
jgi:uncharacterized protein YjbI with pentapeptide repeats